MVNSPIPKWDLIGFEPWPNDLSPFVLPFLLREGPGLTVGVAGVMGAGVAGAIGGEGNGEGTESSNPLKGPVAGAFPTCGSKWDPSLVGR